MKRTGMNDIKDILRQRHGLGLTRDRIAAATGGERRHGHVRRDLLESHRPKTPRADRGKPPCLGTPLPSPFTRYGSALEYTGVDSRRAGSTARATRKPYWVWRFFTSMLLRNAERR